MDEELGRGLSADRFKPHPGKQEKPPLPKRFYKEAASAPADEGFTVLLDGRRLKTPARKSLYLPTEGLATALAEEWGRQGEHIDPFAMPLTRLANTAIDRVEPQRAAVIDETVKFADTDLLCYRAEFPEALARRQHAAWQPLLDWAEAEYGARLAVTAGILPVAQPPEAFERLRVRVAELDDFALSGLQNAVSLFGSLILGLAVLRGRVDDASAFEAAHLDEAFQAEQWGEDAEAAQRLAQRRAELAETGRFLRLLGAPE